MILISIASIHITNSLNVNICDYKAEIFVKDAKTYQWLLASIAFRLILIVATVSHKAIHSSSKLHNTYN